MNQNPEQLARDTIDRLLSAAGWVVQSNSNLLLKIFCSTYQLWKKVLDYLDVFQVGLTATPNNRSFGYFEQNLMSTYGYEEAVIDGVLVPYNVFTIETKITKYGGIIPMGEKVDKRERLTRRKFWESVDEDINHNNKKLDKILFNHQLLLWK